MNENPESMRLLNELALDSGRKRQSPQTGYLHYFHPLVEPDVHLSIPIVENFLFALALLKSRTIENIQEAKTMLEGLINFQNQKEDDSTKGNFPIYLHEYPACKDRFTSIYVAEVIIRILKQFSQVIGSELKKKLESALLLAIQQAIHTTLEKKPSYSVAIKISCIAIVVGQLLGNQQLENDGLEKLEALRAISDDVSWFCPNAMGSIMASLFLIYPQLSESPWKAFWNHIQNTWHRGTSCYAGPGLKEWQEKEVPQMTLYDLFCGYFSGKFSDRMLKESPVHLEAVLIPITNERFHELSYPFHLDGMVNGARWSLHQEEDLAYSWVEKGKMQMNPVYEKGFHPFKLLWGDGESVRTMVCQGGNVNDIAFDGTDIIFDLDRPVEVEDREKAREILFFLNMFDGMEFLVSSKKASTFVLGEELIFKDKNLKLLMSFNLEAGEGRFLGHRMPGNRPSQMAIKGTAKFHAYDWQIFLRTINRSDKCRIRVKLKIQKNV